MLVVVRRSVERASRPSVRVEEPRPRNSLRPLGVKSSSPATRGKPTSAVMGEWNVHALAA